ncbi:hypothetical protein [Thalassobacillus sp. CUG 92003]|uniref:hypothetical protein n=1 Tax=Thalassobacillus sp. CUG 92003 TaxID=2736641 RepID=UPI0015E72881|nr:hypothetical protein [Thalassobacillus sp. CUG 92003]
MGTMLFVISFVMLIYLVIKVGHVENVLKKQQADHEEMKSLLKVIIKGEHIR